MESTWVLEHIKEEALCAVKNETHRPEPGSVEALCNLEARKYI